MTTLFSSPKSTPQPQIVYQTATAPDSSAAAAEAEEAANKQRRAKALARGRASTLLSGGEGLTSKAPVKLKQALGE